jgi:hypothetical protein
MVLWWVYDEKNIDEPGWKQWEMTGRFKLPPEKHLDSLGVYVLGSSGKEWKVWSVQKGHGLLNEVEREAAASWGQEHKALTVASTGLADQERWLSGPSAFIAQIDEMLGDTEFMDKLHRLRARSESAPLSWPIGSCPSPSWSASMGMWSQRWEEHLSQVWNDNIAHPEFKLWREARYLFLERLAAGSTSPAQSWLEVLNEAHFVPVKSWGQHLGVRMQEVEIEVDASRAAASEVKSMRI